MSLHRGASCGLSLSASPIGNGCGEGSGRKQYGWKTGLELYVYMKLENISIRKGEPK